MTQPELTKRQSDVLHWIQQAQSNKQIAKRLKVSESTIKSHVGSLMKKYCCRSRSQLALFSLAGKAMQLPDQLPDDVEPKPCGWVLRKKRSVVAVSFEQDQPSPEWEAMYTKRGNRL